MFLRAYCFVNGLTLSCLGSLYSRILLIKSICAFIVSVVYSESPPLRNTLFYVWSIFIAKDRRYPKYFILCVVYFYSERTPLCRGVMPETLVELTK